MQEPGQNDHSRAGAGQHDGYGDPGGHDRRRGTQQHQQPATIKPRGRGGHQRNPERRGDRADDAIGGHSTHATCRIEVPRQRDQLREVHRPGHGQGNLGGPQCRI